MVSTSKIDIISNKYKIINYKIKGSVLIIDDNEIIRKVTSKLIQSIGYTPITAINGLDGIQKYKDNIDNIDFVMLDMMMPVMNGEEAFYKLKNINNNIKIIIFSDLDNDIDIDYLIQCGAIFLKKPFNINEFMEAIIKLYDNKQQYIKKYDREIVSIVHTKDDCCGIS